MKLENTLKSGLSMLPDDVKMLGYDVKFHQLFNDPKPSGDDPKPSNDDPKQSNDDPKPSSDDGAARQTSNEKCRPFDDLPSFKLISQESPIMPPVDNVSNVEGAESEDTGSSYCPKEVGQIKKGNRVLKPSRYCSLPYMHKQTDVLAFVSDLEWVVSGSIFSMKGDPMKTVFETKSGQMTPRVVMESLAPSLLLYSNIIDTWSTILNEEQCKDGGSISRLFLHTSIMSENMWDGSLSIDKSYEIFETNMLVTFEDQMDILSMRDVNLVFFHNCK